MKRVAIVAPHFIPSNLTSVHRSRLWSWHLKEFGWEPIIVTTHWRYYEESLDWELQAFVPHDLSVVRTAALSTKPIRLIGDIGVRSLWGHYRALSALAQNGEIDFLLITIPSNYSALLGRMIWRKYRIPFGIDYIDPWVHEWPGSEKIMSKAWISRHLGKLLEPWAVEHCSLITGVADGYFEGVLVRNPHLRAVVHTASMPYGISVRDFDLARKKKRGAYLLAHHGKSFNFLYAGAMLPHATRVLERLLEALVSLEHATSGENHDVKFHFVGTGKSPDDPLGYNIRPAAWRYGLGDRIYEHPNRISYVDTLTHLLGCSAVLVVGSDRPHYTPSKVFQAIVSEKPVFAILHEDSDAVDTIKACEAGDVFTFSRAADISAPALGKRLAMFLKKYRGKSHTPNFCQFEPFSARHSACVLASALNRVSRGAHCG